MNDIAMDIRDLHRTFKVSRGAFRKGRMLTAVDRVSFQVQRGEVLGLVGESGSGKTTVARMLLRLLRPTSGEILLDGVPIDSFDRLQLASRLQPVFQDPYSSLNPRQTISTIISSPLRIQGLTDRKIWQPRVEEMMEMVGLSHRLLNSYPKQLSGGQRQRVAIARALINRPKIVICDEPTSALDVSMQAQILNLLESLRGDLGLTYILISHDLAVVEHMANRVAVMYLGRIVEVGDTETLFETPKHPYTQSLLQSVLTVDPGKGVPNTQLGVTFPNPIDPPSGCTFHPRCAHARDICKLQKPKQVTFGTQTVECHLYDGELACRADQLEDPETAKLVSSSL